MKKAKADVTLKFFFQRTGDQRIGPIYIMLFCNSSSILRDKLYVNGPFLDVKVKETEDHNVNRL